MWRSDFSARSFQEKLKAGLREDTSGGRMLKINKQGFKQFLINRIPNRVTN